MNGSNNALQTLQLQSQALTLLPGAPTECTPEAPPKQVSASEAQHHSFSFLYINAPGWAGAGLLKSLLCLPIVKGEVLMPCLPLIT